ncbi:hypothetical protein LCGC14_1388120 [marine sediment metagenome]|uniref:Uncharacterized protein n=1 Tax=marine sediment metagenome TaxID=412755 RepID=A0A0F9N2B8_9ZZZZ
MLIELSNKVIVNSTLIVSIHPTGDRLEFEDEWYEVTFISGERELITETDFNLILNQRCGGSHTVRLKT